MERAITSLLSASVTQDDDSNADTRLLRTTTYLSLLLASQNVTLYAASAQL